MCLHLRTNENVILGIDKIAKTPKECLQYCIKTISKIYQSNATCDQFLTDQILPFIFLAKGKSTFSTVNLTQHSKTNIWLLQKFSNNKKFTSAPSI
ncbi:MAG: RNA 3'-terminal phosphate cyclase [Candidatus Helarchaeota archaeon]